LKSKPFAWQDEYRLIFSLTNAWHLRTRSTLWCGMELHKSVNAQSTNPMI
jgi:hypothetical protein